MPDDISKEIAAARLAMLHEQIATYGEKVRELERDRLALEREVRDEIARSKADRLRASLKSTRSQSSE